MKTIALLQNTNTILYIDLLLKYIVERYLFYIMEIFVMFFFASLWTKPKARTKDNFRNLNWMFASGTNIISQ